MLSPREMCRVSLMEYNFVGWDGDNILKAELSPKRNDPYPMERGSTPSPLSVGAQENIIIWLVSKTSTKLNFQGVSPFHNGKPNSFVDIPYYFFQITASGVSGLAAVLHVEEEPNIGPEM